MAKQLGKYEIIRTLGQGAMGEVYLAQHPTIGREVAIKTILPSAARGEDAEGRFRREATAAGKLNHPNLVTIYDFDKDGDVLYLVMEYVKGDDLDDLIQQHALSQSQFLEVLAQICDGLSFAHRNGIIHRDIKPTNVRVIRDGKRILSKVMDFGIARTDDSNMTATGIVMGTVSYMAPEYIQSGNSTAQGDLWAVGVMLYECLTGGKPFHGDNTTTILFKIVSETPKPVEPGAIQGVSPSIRLVLEKALAKDPAFRFQTADDFAKSLRACKDPNWTGSIEEATAMVAQHPSSMAAEADQNGTLLLQSIASQSMAAASTPTMVSSVPPTAVVSSITNSNTPTTVLQPEAPLQPRTSAPVKGGSKAGVYIAAGLGLAVIGVGGWYLLGRRHQVAAETAQVAASGVPAAPATGQSATPAVTSGGSAAPANPVPNQVSAPVSTKGGQSPNASVTPPAAIKSGVTPRPEPSKPVEDTPAQKLDKAVALIGSNPGQAAGTLRGLAASQPGDPAVQGNLLAALYRSRNAGEFERALDAAKGRGLNTTTLMKAAPAFREAMVDERTAQKAKNGTNVLPAAVLIKAMQ